MKSLRTEDEIIRSWKGDPGQPLVSVCCITYNHEKYLEDALHGFLIQETGFPFEILVHDDASTDGTAAILRDYEARYPRIIKPIYQLENQHSKGLSISDTFQFPRAKGKYIALCEGDDYWVDPLKLQLQVDFLEANSDYVIAYTDCVPFDESGPLAIDFRGRKRDLAAIELQKGTPIFTLTTCFRNVLRDAPAILAIAKHGDMTFWSRLGDVGKGKYLPNIKPSMYRVHSGGVHSMQAHEARARMRLQTLMALFLYRMNAGHKALANHFAVEIILGLARLMSWELLILLVKRGADRVRRRLKSLPP